MVAPQFEMLTPDNFSKFQDPILHSEMIYPEPIRSTPDEYAYIINSDGAIALVEIVDSKYIGNTIGCNLTDEEAEEYGIMNDVRGFKTFYIYNLVIENEYHGKGYAHLLLLELIKAAKNKGEDLIVGHFRQNGALKLIKKIGAQEKGVFRNWEDTGEDYVLCLLDLRNINIEEISKILNPCKEQLSPQEQPAISPAPLTNQLPCTSQAQDARA